MAGPSNLDAQFRNLLVSTSDVEFIDLAAPLATTTKRSLYRFHHATGSAKSGEGFSTAFTKVIEYLVFRVELAYQWSIHPQKHAD